MNTPSFRVGSGVLPRHPRTFGRTNEVRASNIMSEPVQWDDLPAWVKRQRIHDANRKHSMAAVEKAVPHICGAASVSDVAMAGAYRHLYNAVFRTPKSLPTSVSLPPDPPPPPPIVRRRPAVKRKAELFVPRSGGRRPPPADNNMTPSSHGAFEVGLHKLYDIAHDIVQSAGAGHVPKAAFFVDHGRGRVLAMLFVTVGIITLLIHGMIRALKIQMKKDKL